ncbi:MAG: ribonuclease J [Chloroflexi bacterium]|nr:ribonuclease J [Chloroflexota bacterium]|tara:strand:+ start:58279 stop:59940 length:1662 start_codon:yes stop_codon:yes gene_type:complete
MAKDIKIIPLGGLGEVGKNMLCVEYDKDIVIIDAGLMFPKDNMPGIDLLLPNMKYLEDNQSRIKGILITHGHEDHIGAIPYLLRKLNPPIYAPPLACDLIKTKLREHPSISKSVIREISTGEHLKLGKLSIEYFNVCHSIPDACGVIIKTPLGTIVHTGDFKIDHTPVDNRAADLQRLGELGREGVLLLLSDSTYAEVPGYTPSERTVTETLDWVINKSKGRVLVATFASLISRVQQVVDIAFKHDRKVSLVGRSMVNNITMSLDKGYLKADPRMILPLEQLNALPAKSQLIVLTGAQGEPLSVLSRIANKRHREISIMEGDTVIISATPIPGNEVAVASVIDGLVRQGAKVITRRNIPGVHVPGHASQEELKLMLRLLTPQYFIPIHGEYRMLVAHSELAAEVGIPKENIFVIQDGDVLNISGTHAEVIDKIPTDDIFIDGLQMWELPTTTLRNRRTIGKQGIVLIVVTNSEDNGQHHTNFEIVSKGFVDIDEGSNEIFELAKDYLSEATQTIDITTHDEESLNRLLVDLLRPFFYKATKKRPMIVATLINR